MFWKKSGEHPDKEIAQRVLAILAENPKGMYTFAHLLEKIPDVTPGQLSGVLANLATTGKIGRTVRVYSSTGGGIADFKSSLDIPEEIYDERTGSVLQVTPDKIKILFGDAGSIAA
jgi:ornithine cyclodeaminase/alanine dehydrogenase-like protein (mu-crystallin family)